MLVFGSGLVLVLAVDVEKLDTSLKVSNKMTPSSETDAFSISMSRVLSVNDSMPIGIESRLAFSGPPIQTSISRWSVSDMEVDDSVALNR